MLIFNKQPKQTRKKQDKTAITFKKQEEEEDILCMGMESQFLLFVHRRRDVFILFVVIITIAVLSTADEEADAERRVV